MTVNNIGNVDLQVSAINCEKNWISPISSANFTIKPGEQVIVDVWCNVEGLSDGHYTGALKIESNDPDTPIFNVPLALDVNIVNVDIAKGEIPNNYFLKQNYPNPFNPSTTIEFTVSKTSPVSLKIYDIMGREIKTLVNRTMSPGEYKVKFNAENLSSGVYIYSIKAHGFYEAKKMTILK